MCVCWAQILACLSCKKTHVLLPPEAVSPCLDLLPSSSPWQSPTHRTSWLFCAKCAKWLQYALSLVVTFPLSFFPCSCAHRCTLPLIRIYVQLLWRWLLGLWRADVIDSDCVVVGWRKQYRARRWRRTSVTSERGGEQERKGMRGFLGQEQWRRPAWCRNKNVGRWGGGGLNWWGEQFNARAVKVVECGRRWGEGERIIEMGR